MIFFWGFFNENEKNKTAHLFFDINYKLSTGVDQQYIIDCFPFMKFANIDRVLYQYRQACSSDYESQSKTNLR